MRVGLFTYGMRDRLTGIGRYAHELSYALRDLDPQVELILLTPYPDSPLPWYRDFPCHPLPTLSRLPAVIALGSVLLERAARGLALDVLHDPCGIAPFAAPRSTVRRVVTIHDAIPFVHPEVQPPLTRLVFHTLVRAARWTSDAVITVSKSARTDLLRHTAIAPARLHAIPRGIRLPRDEDLAEWRQGFAPVAERHDIAQPYILYVGACNPRKNVGRLIEAFARVRGRHARARLVLVGPDSPLARALRGTSVWDPTRMRFLEYVDTATLHVLYANAAAVAVPSLYEGFGLPVLEAMAHGAPVVASDRSSLPEVLGDCGLLIDPMDTAALASALDRILADKERAATLARLGRERAQGFTRGAEAAATLAVYREVCARGAASAPRAG